MEKKETIKLGDKVKDNITGVIGIAISRIEYLHGCTQFGIQAKAKDGNVPKVEWIDEPQLTRVALSKQEKRTEKPKYGGMRQYPK